jgi:hypothetical protein
MSQRHEQRYQDAIERNVRKSLGNEKYNVPNKTQSPEDMVNRMRDIKHCLGIRVNDSKYDTEIKARVNGK